MLRRSPRRTLEAIVTQAIALIVALGGSNFKRFLTKQAQSKSIELPGSPYDISLSYARGGNFLAREVAALIRNLRGEVGHRNESPEFTTQVSLVGSSTSRSIE
jgi:hypothetical protein